MNPLFGGLIALIIGLFVGVFVLTLLNIWICVAIALIVLIGTIYKYKKSSTPWWLIYMTFATGFALGVGIHFIPSFQLPY